jgi:hypothetical protein
MPVRAPGQVPGLGPSLSLRLIGLSPLSMEVVNERSPNFVGVLQLLLQTTIYHVGIAGDRQQLTRPYHAVAELLADFAQQRIIVLGELVVEPLPEPLRIHHLGARRGVDQRIDQLAD